MIQTFSAEIFKVAMNYAVQVPKHVTEALNKNGYVPVKGKVNGMEFKGTLVPRKENTHIMYLKTDIRKKAGVGEFDTVEVILEFDPVSRDIPVPEDVEMIFRENITDWEAFIHLSPSARREILKYIVDARKPETRLNRILKIRERMREFKK